MAGLKMQSLVTRCAAAGVLLVVTTLPVFWIQAGYRPAEVVLPKGGFQIPEQLGEWRGEHQPMDPRLVASVNADQMLNRLYQSEEGAIAMHLARWKGEDGTPHLPTICYQNNGWRTVSETTVSVEPAPGRKFRAKCLTLELSGEFVQVAFWYQLGPHLYCENQGYQQARRHYWQTATWPAVTKVLLHRHISAPDASHRPLQEFATRVAVSLAEPDPKP